MRNNLHITRGSGKPSGAVSLLLILLVLAGAVVIATSAITVRTKRLQFMRSLSEVEKTEAAITAAREQIFYDITQGNPITTYYDAGKQGDCSAATPWKIIGGAEYCMEDLGSNRYELRVRLQGGTKVRKTTFTITPGSGSGGSCLILSGLDCTQCPNGVTQIGNDYVCNFPSVWSNGSFSGANWNSQYYDRPMCWDNSRNEDRPWVMWDTNCQTVGEWMQWEQTGGDSNPMRWQSCGGSPPTPYTSCTVGVDQPCGVYQCVPGVPDTSGELYWARTHLIAPLVIELSHLKQWSDCNAIGAVEGGACTTKWDTCYTDSVWETTSNWLGTSGSLVSGLRCLPKHSTWRVDLVNPAIGSENMNPYIFDYVGLPQCGGTGSDSWYQVGWGEVNIVPPIPSPIGYACRYDCGVETGSVCTYTGTDFSPCPSDHPLVVNAGTGGAGGMPEKCLARQTSPGGAIDPDNTGMIQNGYDIINPPDMPNLSSTCGNGTIDLWEACDPGNPPTIPQNLNGLDCTDFGFIGGGPLGCDSNCRPITSACTGRQQWFKTGNTINCNNPCPIPMPPIPNTCPSIGVTCGEDVSGSCSSNIGWEWVCGEVGVDIDPPLGEPCYWNPAGDPNCVEPDY